MRKKTRSKDIKDSYSYRVGTPDGTLYVFISVDENNKATRIDASAGKTGNSLSAWSFGICALINELLDRGVDITKITSILSNITTGVYRVNQEGVKIYAGPDAIKTALLSFIKDTYSVGIGTG